MGNRDINKETGKAKGNRETGKKGNMGNGAEKKLETEKQETKGKAKRRTWRKKRR